MAVKTVIFYCKLEIKASNIYGKNQQQIIKFRILHIRQLLKMLLLLKKLHL